MLNLSWLGVLIISYAAIVGTNRFLFQITMATPDRTKGPLLAFEILAVLGNVILLFGFFAAQGL
jgi:hypothetical protein